MPSAAPRTSASARAANAGVITRSALTRTTRPSRSAASITSREMPDGLELLHGGRRRLLVAPDRGQQPLDVLAALLQRHPVRGQAHGGGGAHDLAARVQAGQHGLDGSGVAGAAGGPQRIADRPARGRADRCPPPGDARRGARAAPIAAPPPPPRGPGPRRASPRRPAGARSAAPPPPRPPPPARRRGGPPAPRARPPRARPAAPTARAPPGSAAPGPARGRPRPWTAGRRRAARSGRTRRGRAGATAGSARRTRSPGCTAAPPYTRSLASASAAPA